MDWENEPEWVELGECDSEQELLVVRALLESEGIECLSPIIYEYEGRTAEGGFPLHVRQADLAKARAILDAPVELPATESDDEDTDSLT